MELSISKVNDIDTESKSRKPIRELKTEADIKFRSACHLFLWLRRVTNKLVNLTNDNYFKIRKTADKEEKKEIIYDNCRIATEIYYLLNTYLPDIIEGDDYNVLNTKHNCIKFHEKMYEIYDDIFENINRYQTNEQKQIIKALVYELTQFDTETLPKKFRSNRHNDYKNDCQHIDQIVEFDMLDGYCL